MTEGLPAMGASIRRCRFAMDGLPVGWVGDEEVRRGTRAEDVLMRDPLRHDSGAAPGGYTLEEALLLCQSSSSLQRRAGALLTASGSRNRCIGP